MLLIIQIKPPKDGYAMNTNARDEKTNISAQMKEISK
jgi:hypothetical protein